MKTQEEMMRVITKVRHARWCMTDEVARIRQKMLAKRRELDMLLPQTDPAVRLQLDELEKEEAAIVCRMTQHDSILIVQEPAFDGVRQQQLASRLQQLDSRMQQLEGAGSACNTCNTCSAGGTALQMNEATLTLVQHMMHPLVEQLLVDNKSLHQQFDVRVQQLETKQAQLETRQAQQATQQAQQAARMHALEQAFGREQQVVAGQQLQLEARLQYHEQCMASMWAPRYT
jgi:hypothetical protein